MALKLPLSPTYHTQTYLMHRTILLLLNAAKNLPAVTDNHTKFEKKPMPVDLQTVAS